MRASIVFVLLLTAEEAHAGFVDKIFIYELGGGRRRVAHRLEWVDPETGKPGDDPETAAAKKQYLETRAKFIAKFGERAWRESVLGNAPLRKKAVPARRTRVGLTPGESPLNHAFGVVELGGCYNPIALVERVTPIRPTQQFGDRTARDHTHKGIDLGAPEGTFVRAPWAGRVTNNIPDAPSHQREQRRRAGHFMELEHHLLDGRVIMTRFLHLKEGPLNGEPQSRREPDEGERVSAGQIIGAVGRTGVLRSGAHLHFEVWVDGRPVDPEEICPAVRSALYPHRN